MLKPIPIYKVWFVFLCKLHAAVKYGFMQIVLSICNIFHAFDVEKEGSERIDHALNFNVKIHKNGGICITGEYYSI